MIQTGYTTLFSPSPNPLEELCTILARGYLRLLLAREKEKVVPLDKNRNNSQYQVELT